MGFIRSVNRVAFPFFAIIFIIGFLARCDTERDEARTIKQIQSGDPVHELPKWASELKLNSWQVNFNKTLAKDILEFHEFIESGMDAEARKQFPGDFEVHKNKRRELRSKLKEAAISKRINLRKRLMRPFEGLFLINELYLKDTEKGATLDIELGLIGSGNVFEFQTDLTSTFPNTKNYKDLRTNVDWTELSEGQLVRFAGDFAPKIKNYSRKKGHTCSWTGHARWEDCHINKPKSLFLISKSSLTDLTDLRLKIRQENMPDMPGM